MCVLCLHDCNAAGEYHQHIGLLHGLESAGVHDCTFWLGRREFPPADDLQWLASFAETFLTDCDKHTRPLCEVGRDIECLAILFVMVTCLPGAGQVQSADVGMLQVHACQ